jgi:hypothetical protein
MKDVFILGAGFSRAATDGRMPVMSELMDKVKAEYKKKFPSESNNDVDKYTDLEFMLSKLFIKQPFDTETSYYSNLAFYHKVSEILVEVLNEAEKPFLDRFENFITQGNDWSESNLKGLSILDRANEVSLGKFWSYQFCELEPWISPIGSRLLSYLIKTILTREEITLITFNYDTLIELEWSFQVIRLLNDKNFKERDILAPDILRNLVNFKTFYGAQSLYPQKVPLSDYRFGQVTHSSHRGFDKFPQPTFQLLKLHGSLNLCWDKDLQSPVYFCDKSSRDLQTFIIPPVLDKTNELSHPYLKLNWRLAQEALKEAARVFIVGYSLPLTDFSTRSMLFNSQFERDIPLEVYLVNNSKNVKDATEKVFSQSNINDQFTGKDNAIDEFVQWYVKN